MIDGILDFMFPLRSAIREMRAVNEGLKELDEAIALRDAMQSQQERDEHPVFDDRRLREKNLTEEMRNHRNRIEELEARVALLEALTGGRET